MKDLVAIKVKIGRHNNKKAKYPDFNKLDIVKRSGTDWSIYIDVEGSGWLYDCCGHDEEDGDSPAGQQWGMLLISEQFADEAVNMFPGECFFMTDVEAEHFYNHKCAKDVDEEDIDVETLQKIKLKKDLGLQLTDEDNESLDVMNDRRGIRKNWRKKFQDFKSKRAFNVKNR